MKKIITLALVILVFLASIMPITALATETEEAKTETVSFELTTRSVLIIDRSGSIKDQEEVNAIAENVTASYDAVVYFDDGQISVNPEFIGGGNSHICEQIDLLVKSGFTHIGVITDGQQWPANYNSLGLYTDITLTMYLVGDKQKEAEELVNELKDRMVHSDLKVISPDGEETVVLSEYEAPLYEIEVPMPIPDQKVIYYNTFPEGVETGKDDVEEKSNCKWLWAFLGGILVAAIFDLIHELITRKNSKDNGSNPTNGTASSTPVKPIPSAVVTTIAKDNLYPVCDVSYSMAGQQAATQEACERAGNAPKALCFGDSIYECNVDKLSTVTSSGKTAGWEALEEVQKKGKRRILLVSDLEFNQKPFDKNNFLLGFDKILVVTPTTVNQKTMENLAEITDEIEVVYL